MLSVTTCGCAGADHELRCGTLRVLEERGRLFAGLYDRRRALGPPVVSRVKLLNPWLIGDDPVARRFALLEVD